MSYQIHGPYILTYPNGRKVEVEVFVDPLKLAETIGKKAERNVRGIAKSCFGAIMVKVKQ